jgi:hypothetical protein
MGEGFGEKSPVTQHSPTIYAAIELAPGAALVIDHEADERALYLMEGDASVDGTALIPQHLSLIAPGYLPFAVVGGRCPPDALRRRADGWRAARLVEFRVLAPRPDQRGEARLALGRVRASAGRS